MKASSRNIALSAEDREVIWNALRARRAFYLDLMKYYKPSSDTFKDFDLKALRIETIMERLK